MRLLSYIVASAMLVAACGTDDTTAGGDGGAASPIAEFLGDETALAFQSGDRAAAEAAFADQERARQEVIAACMKREGFDYIPTDPSQYGFFEEADGLEYGSEEWTAKYGFGITTQRFSQAEVGPNLVGFDDSRFQDAQQSDPNQPIVDAMSEAERDAYDEALYGGEDASPAFDETLSEEEAEAHFEDFEFEPQGCAGEAYSEDPSQEFYLDFSGELNEMYERIEADPRIAKAEQEITDCMSEKGLNFNGMESLYEMYEDDLSKIDSEVGFPGEDLTEEEFDQLSEAEIEAMFNQPRTLTDEHKARLAELQEEEIGLATAVSECGGGFDAQQELYSEIVAEYEQQFLEEYADRLEGYGG